MSPLINRETGEEATPEQYEACMRRARQILENPYSSPEQLAWALQFPGMELVFWESCRQMASRRRQQGGES